jgi:ABC-type multidrug transport system fused ATPase/permease subunit
VVSTASPLVLSALDEIVLLEGDRVVARGTHSELMADARYRVVVTREDS